MKIILDDSVKSYLKEHHHHDMTLKLQISDCCTGNINSKRPDISFKEPKHLENFDEYDIDEFRVFVQKDIDAYDDTLTFTDSKLIFRHAPNVIGLNLDHVSTM